MNSFRLTGHRLRAQPTQAAPIRPVIPPAQKADELQDDDHRTRRRFGKAQVAGGDWPQRAAAAFARLTRQEDIDARGEGVTLLSDFQSIFAETGGDRIWTEVLCERLNKLPEHPYADI